MSRPQPQPRALVMLSEGFCPACRSQLVPAEDGYLACERDQVTWRLIQREWSGHWYLRCQAPVPSLDDVVLHEIHVDYLEGASMPQVVRAVRTGVDSYR